MRPPAPPFMAFTIKHKGLSGRIITPISLSAAFDPAQPPEPLPPQHQTTALWDTGASRSVITPSTARALGLVSVGTIMMNHAGGCSPSNTYLVNFFLPNNVGIRGVLVSESADIPNGDFGALIGMDIISIGDFSITNVNRQTWMTFRIPSIETIDYVVESDRLLYAGVQRNAPCPCGSGKKFKHCHGEHLAL
jgi:hypothetical protein